MAVNPLSARSRQKGIVRSDISQTLTGAEKTTARGNIDAASKDQFETKAVRADATQTFSTTQKKTARDNIDAVPTARKIIMGPGMKGAGGDMTADRTAEMGTPSNITRLSKSAVAGESHTHEITADDFRDMVSTWLTATQVGSVVYARNMTTVDIAYGGNINGVNLAPASDTGTASTRLTGRWVCLGYGVAGGATTWMRYNP